MKKTGNNHDIESLIKICKDQAEQMPRLRHWWETTESTLTQLMNSATESEDNLRKAIDAFNTLATGRGGVLLNTSVLMKRLKDGFYDYKTNITEYLNQLQFDWTQADEDDTIGQLICQTAKSMISLAEELEKESQNEDELETIARAIYAAVINDDEVEKYRKQMIDRNKRAQAAGIKAAKLRNVKFGRPATPVPENFMEILEAVKNGELTVVAAAKQLRMGTTSFYRMKNRVLQQQQQEPDFEVVPVPPEDADEETPVENENPVEMILPTQQQLDAVTEALEETAQKIRLCTDLEEYVQPELTVEEDETTTSEEESEEAVEDDENSRDLEHPDYPGIKVTFAEYYLLEQFHGRTELFGHTLEEMSPDLFERIRDIKPPVIAEPVTAVETEKPKNACDGKHAPVGAIMLECPGVQSCRYVITKNNNIIDTQTGRRMTTMYKSGEQVVQLRTPEGGLILLKMIDILANTNVSEEKKSESEKVEEENLLEDFVWIDWMEGIPVRKYKVFKTGRIWDNLNGEWLRPKCRRISISGGDKSSRTIGVVNRTSSIYVSTLVWRAFHREDRDAKKLHIGFKDGDQNNCRLDNLIRKGGD